MKALIVNICFCILNVLCVNRSASAVDRKCELHHKIGNIYFPSNFSFGVSTAAYQIEGAWNEDNKGPSIWDTFTHNHPEMIDDRSTGDVGPDSYHRFQQDLEILKRLQVQIYRFSISWSRVLPIGDVTTKNEKGIEYYNMVINNLLDNNIRPMVTMYHYDMPEELRKFGGFTNPLFIKYFKYYANLLFQEFGDRVKLWITFNEPFDYCNPGYGKANYPPMIHSPGQADYICMETTLKAHAAAYRLYRKRYFRKQRGKIGITLSSRFYFNKNNASDVVNRGLQYSLGWLANPLFSAVGNYPEEMIADIVSNSIKEGRPWSRLRSINEKWYNVIKGAGDFLGLNYYTSRYIERASPAEGEKPSWENDAQLKFTIDPMWKRAKSSWLYCVPEGLEELLKWIRDQYNNIEVIVTENGWSDNGLLEDDERIDYLKSHLQAVLNAINAGCNVSGYIHWSLLDNFEWQRGYTEKFGLYYVNMSSPNKERREKKSARYYKEIIKRRSLISN